MSVQVYGCNHIAIEVDDVGAAVKFYQDVFNLKKMDGGEGDAFLKLGEHQISRHLRSRAGQGRPGPSFWTHCARRETAH
jgi:extradiol dioxygenase family protein